MRIVASVDVLIAAPPVNDLLSYAPIPPIPRHHLTMRRRKGRAVPAVIDVHLDPPNSASIEKPSPIRDGEWADADGRRWRLRGKHQEVSLKRVQNLMNSPEVRVVLLTATDYMLNDVAMTDREALWRQISPYLSGRVDRSDGDHTEFYVGEFKDDLSRSMLIVEESC